ncbi:MAG: ArsR/SmtB family transcription factor [Actinomycetota bacterium]
MENLKNMVKTIKALADEGRLRIILLLLERDNLCVCEIKEVIGLSQPTISIHLKSMENVGLIESRKEGLWVNYCINKEIKGEIKKIIKTIKNSLAGDSKIEDDRKKIRKVDRRKICKK